MKWFRFYDEVLDDPKVQRLPPAQFKAWVNLLCLANRQEPRGTLPDLATIAFALRISPPQAERVILEFQRCGLLDGQEVHNWDARQPSRDEVGQRVQSWREKKRTERVTCNTEGNTESNAASATQRRSRGDTEERRGEEKAEAEENALQLLPARPNIFALFENLCGTVTPILEAELREAEVEYPPGWVETAFKAAADANVRKWSYVRSILRRYADEGFQEPEEEIDWTARANEYVEAYNSGGQLRTLP